MEIKQVEVIDGKYQCDIGITADEWKGILLDEKFKPYLDVLVKFHSEPQHKSTCKELGEKYGVSPQSFNSLVMNFGKAVQKNINRFEVKGIDKGPTYWIIVMTGKSLPNGLFEWTLRPELVTAMEELNVRAKLFLQKIYDEAIASKHWVFFDWFPLYKRNVKEYIEQCISDKWSGDVFQRLVKDTTDNGVSNLQQGNFTWEEFNKIKTRWPEIQPVVKEIAINASISEEQYRQVIQFFGRNSKQNRPAGSNRVIAAFLPNVVTTVVSYGYLKGVLTQLKKALPDYPKIEGDWLNDNLNFIQYCNSHIEFKDSWHSSLFAWYLIEHFENETKINKENKASMQKYIDLLLANQNLILTGAPGTGKTYLAKEIAKHLTGLKTDKELEQSSQYAFVQFHPSYDYTDFVEGLRPTPPDDKGNIGFERKDGAFKEFCKEAIKKEDTNNFEEQYAAFIDELSESTTKFKTPSKKNPFKVEINSNKTCVAIPETDIGTRMSITKEMIRTYCLTGKIRDWKPYTVPIAEYFMKNYDLKMEAFKEERRYVIIIDEINRAEISKVFGELFFSIDAGYRGVKGRVKTQYSNIQDDSDIFKDGFYVPENVYILGTMNDIDRSVESFDFAMRRRFAWEEVKAEDRKSMWDGQIDDWKDEARKRMNALNSKIESIPGLTKAFHIGPAYFLKLQNYDGDFKQLWDYHLQSILFEYLRGMPQNDQLLKDLKAAFELTEEPQGNAGNN